MCFAPQRRALFRHRNFQKWSDHGVFCTFWLGNVLRATTACTFSTSQLPKVVRDILTWKCASRHTWKSARRCGAKHISKSTGTKHTILGPLLEVEMSKKCTPLWREAHLQVKMYKAHQVRTTFGNCDVEKVHAVVARSTFRTTFGSCDVDKVYAVVVRSTFQKTPGVRTTFGGSDIASRGKTWGCCSNNHHYTTLHSNTLHSITLHYAPLHYTTVHYTTLTSTTLHYTTLHYMTLHYTTLHYTTLQSTTLQYITLHYTPLHYTTLHYTTFHYTSLHYTTLDSTTLQLQLHNYTTTLHYTPLQ